MQKPSVVYLIDHKGRDLMGAALIAYHLEKLGIVCHMEPLQSWRSSLPAWKPNLILFNHLLSKELANYSSELHKRGILVAVMLNEGLCLGDTQRKYLSQKQHPNVHCDLYLTWNDLHRDELIKQKFVSKPEKVITTGVPRFDFYKQPWLTAYQGTNKKSLAQVLVNTTFALAHFHERTEEEQATLISALGEGKIPEKKDYKGMIKAHYNGRNKLPRFLSELLNDGSFYITLRPHPREDLEFYTQWINKLPENQQKRISLDGKTLIQEAIITSDIVLNCENCTTSVESWIADKPTLTLTFDKHPAFHTETYSKRSPQISEPAAIIKTLQETLKNRKQLEYQDTRQAYLDTWVHKTDGKCAERAAQAIHQAVNNRPCRNPTYPSDFSSLRRKLKLWLAHAFDEPSHTQLKHWIRWKTKGSSGKQPMKYRNYLKAVRPSESKAAMNRIKKAAQSP